MVDDNGKSNLPDPSSGDGTAGGDDKYRNAWQELTTSVWSDDPALYDGVMLRRVVAYLIDVGILFVSSWFIMILLGVLSLGIAFFFIAAIFTLLDDLPDGRGGKIAGLDPNYEQSIFGQGVTARWRNLEVVDVGEKWHIKKG